MEKSGGIIIVASDVASMAYIINGEKVSDETLKDELESIKEHHLNAGEEVHCDRDEEFWEYACENVVHRVLLEQASTKQFGEVSETEVDAKFAQIIEEHGGEEAFYDNTGFNRGDELMLRRKVKSRLTVDRYLDDQIGDPGEPTDQEVATFYQEHIDHYQTGAQVEVSQLFIEPASHEAAKQTYDELCRARAEILAGADFVTLSRKLSSFTEEEIEMGYVSEGQNMPEMEAMIFSMQPGEVSPIMASPYGFHMFKVTGRNESKPVPMSDIPDLAEALVFSQREEGISQVIARLKSEGSIEKVENA